MTASPQRTPIYEKHVAAGGRMVDFAGWEMPVQYSGILEEHRAVRCGVGVFDISHMGEFVVSGPTACVWLDSMLTNSVPALSPGDAQYTLMLNEGGGVIDDLILYRTGEEMFLLVVNASKIAEDREWLVEHRVDGVEFYDGSADFAALAVQGPGARAVFSEVFAKELAEQRNRVEEIGFGGEMGFVVTTGYTGEDGFELVVPGGVAAPLWDAVIGAGAVPCGLGARDTLRLEMGYPLNGSDLGPDRTPLEAGLGFFVKLDKGEFIGREPLAAQKRDGIGVRLAAISIPGKSPPIRAHYPVIHNGAVVGETSSGALSPSLGHGIAMAYLPAALAHIGTDLGIEVRGRTYQGVVCRKPFYQPKT